MKGRHLISGISNLLFGGLFQLPVIKEKSLIEVKKKFLGIFTCSSFSFDMNTDDVSVIKTSWGGFKTDHVIINGTSHVINSSALNRISELFKTASISMAPLIYSLDKKEPEYVLQVGRETLYCVNGNSWEYKNVSYNSADLGDGKKYVLINSAPIAITDAQKEDYNLSLLKSKGCVKDPYIISPVAIKHKKGSRKRYSYLLLGSEFCFKEMDEIRMEDIVYFDYNKAGGVHFGAGVDFDYPKLQQSEISGIKDFFISKGAELHAEGEKFTTRVTYRISTWIKRRRQTVTLGSRGMFYSRITRKMSKTSFIPYYDFYFIHPIGWRFWGRRLEIFGSQNIQTRHTFKNKDYKRILERIYEFNPRLKDVTGKAYRAFSWNPFKKNKPYVVIGDGMLIHGHPMRKERAALEGTFIKGSKKYGRFYHFFKDVVIDTEPSNIRYDESHVNIEIERYTEGSKIDRDDEWLRSATVPLFVTHLWCRTANKLINAVDGIKGIESSHRTEYKQSEQAIEDIKKRRAIMHEYAQKPSLIKFINDLRRKTGCEIIGIDDSDRSQRDKYVSNYSEAETDYDIEGEIDLEYGSTDGTDTSNALQSDTHNTDKNRDGNLSIRRIIIIATSLVVLALLIFFVMRGITNKKEDSIDNSIAIDATNLRNQTDESTVADADEGSSEEGEIDEGLSVHPDGFAEIIDAEAEESARKFLMNFYSNILPTNKKSWDTGNLVKRYFTPEFARAYRMVDQNTPDGDIGYFDYDLFTRSQDPDYDKAEIKDIIVYSESGNLVAEVIVSLKSKAYPPEEIELTMIQKNNEWMISDYNGELSGMKNYLKMQ